jgi:glycosyltransferase involved in cell wall biosynthesis
MVANANTWKGYEIFIKAAQSVAKRLPTVRFFAVGEVNGDLSADLHGLVEQLNLQKYVTFLGFREDVPEILRDSDLFVLSSLSEGLPLVTLEAMSAGTPVVATRCGGQLELVRDGVSGVLVPPGDANALADSILGLLNDPARGRQMAQAARAVVRDKFSVNAMVHNYEALYDRLLN